MKILHKDFRNNCHSSQHYTYLLLNYSKTKTLENYFGQTDVKIFDRFLMGIKFRGLKTIDIFMDT